MDTVNRDQLQALAEQSHRISVSIFMPFVSAGRQVRQNPIRLKNLLGAAEEKILARGVPLPVAQRILAPVMKLMENDAFWRSQASGLALYLSEGPMQTFRLPLQFPERVVVGERFEVVPLLPLFTAGGRYYLLAVSQGGVRLFEGTPFGLDEVNLENVPRGIRDALKYEVYERHQQVHSGKRAPGIRGKEAAVFHGQGGGVDDVRKKILGYYQKVDRGLHDLLRGSHWPLVLAGLEESLAIYREANAYPHLLEQGIPVNPDSMTVPQLRGAAMKVLKPYFDQARRKAVADYESLAGSPRASGDLAEVLLAAVDGKVDVVLVRPHAECYGRFDSEARTVDVHNSPEPGDENLLNAIAVQTILHRGALFAVEEGLGDSPVAAVFRYAGQSHAAALSQ